MTPPAPSPINGLPVWVKAVAVVGLPSLLVLGLLGFLPWVASPLEIRGIIQNHDAATQRVLRTICKGIWRENPIMMQECER